MRRALWLGLMTAAVVVACSDSALRSGRDPLPAAVDAAPSRVVQPARPAKRAQPVALEPGFTFLVGADTHFGYPKLEPWNRQKVRAMNTLPGTPYPKVLGGRVERPLGVLMAGDLTNSGRGGQWKTFVRYYGLKGGDGELKWPVFEGSGNHDRYGKRRIVPKAIRRRHGRLPYDWSWHGVHFFNLDVCPRISTRRWLARKLRRLGKRAPVVIYFHYSILGYFSEWWSGWEKETFRKTIEGYNVIAIFHGHYHGAERYRWRGFDVYNVGSPLHSFPSFAVVRVTQSHLTVASWNWIKDRWDRWHRKPLVHGPDAKLFPKLLPTLFPSR